MARLSVNVNKVATIRNARGGNNPNLKQVALDCERFGAQGITVHPRPDERHIRYQDVLDLSQSVTTEFNIEGYPDDRFMEILRKVRPHQATLVPDAPDVITSNAGWDTIKHQQFLSRIISEIKSLGIRTSIFLDPNTELISSAVATGTDRIELYTEGYAVLYPKNKEAAIEPYLKTAELAHQNGLGINAGHDLSLENLQYFNQKMPFLDEVSIGHALVCDSLYYGLENTIQMYLRQLQ